jgi:hypothetical protein
VARDLARFDGAAAFPDMKGSDLFGLRWPHWRAAHVIKFTHRTLADDAGG